MENKKEKVTIAEIISEGEKTSKAGKKYYPFQITLSDGRTGKGLGEGFKDVKNGQQIDILIAETEYQGNKQLTFYPVPAEASKGKFPAKDWGAAKRIAALECSVTSFSGLGSGKTTDIIERANEFFKFLNQ